MYCIQSEKPKNRLEINKQELKTYVDKDKDSWIWIIKKHNDKSHRWWEREGNWLPEFTVRHCSQTIKQLKRQFRHLSLYSGSPSLSVTNSAAWPPGKMDLKKMPMFRNLSLYSYLAHLLWVWPAQRPDRPERWTWQRCPCCRVANLGRRRLRSPGPSGRRLCETAPCAYCIGGADLTACKGCFVF